MEKIELKVSVVRFLRSFAIALGQPNLRAIALAQSNLQAIALQNHRSHLTPIDDRTLSI
ncbi:hypothetical protein [Anabaena sp. PCC 7108]|uniref:hypothetical protein n=1 Tax=Anabaena sp. PCC 7108 TaxID=163908 RepID=UPI0003467B88|nr:hypothetical protein [Anabaena sp. PCC 7108]